MIVLALDTASHVMTCELSMDGDVKYHRTERNVQSFVVAAPRLVASAVGSAGLTAREISLYGVNAGPGAWTGIRVGVTFMRALALAAERPLVAVPTYALVCFAKRAQAKRVRFVMRLHGDYLFVVDVDTSEVLGSCEALHATVLESEFEVSDASGIEHIWYGPGPLPARLEGRATQIAEGAFAPGTLTAVAEQFYDLGQAGSPGEVIARYGLPFPVQSSERR